MRSGLRRTAKDGENGPLWGAGVDIMREAWLGWDIGSLEGGSNY